MFPVICKIGPVTLYSYGLMLAIAVSIAILLTDIVYTNIGAIVVALNPFNFKIPFTIKYCAIQ